MSAIAAFRIDERGVFGFVTVSTCLLTLLASMLPATSALSLTSREADSVDVATTFFACKVSGLCRAGSDVNGGCQIALPFR